MTDERPARASLVAYLPGSDFEVELLRQMTPRQRERHAELLATYKRIRQRGPLSLVLVDTALPEGVLAITRLGAPTPLTRYVVVAMGEFDYRIYKKGEFSAFSYQRRHLDDEGPVTITLYRDGRVHAASARLGETTWTIRDVAPPAGEMPDAAGGHAERMTRSIIEAVSRTPPEDVPGVGLASVWRPAPPEDRPPDPIPLATVLVEAALPDGVASIVHLGAAPPLTRFFVTSRSALDDGVWTASQAVAWEHVAAHPEDDGRVTLTIYQDGRVRRTSEKLGGEVVASDASKALSDHRRRVAGVILERTLGTAQQDVPGVGPAWVFELPHQREP